jgi:hypothetical protein
MKPKMTLLRDGDNRKLSLPFADAEAADAAGACPKCKATPFKVSGTGRRIAQDDRAYEADGVCLDCSQRVGVIRIEVNTLFGLREDEAVARLGVKIY